MEDLSLVFDFHGIPPIQFGCGRFENLGATAASHGRSVYLITNAGTPGDGGLVDRAIAQLEGRGLQATVWRQRGEPQVTQVTEALHGARKAAADVVIALGGGSALDMAKAVAGLLANGGGPLDYMEVIGEGRPLTKPAAPWIAVPTTAGTGAECTRNAVIGSPEHRFKASLRSPHLLPRLALVDPELTVSLSPEVTARSGMDALCQLIESYTSRGAQPMTDVLALEGIRRAARALPDAYRDGNDLTARQDMALAATLSGITLSNAGLGAAHGFAAPLGARLPIPHGTICGALLPHVMAANIIAARCQDPPHTELLSRYAAIGRALVGDDRMEDERAAEEGIRFVRDLVDQFSLPRLGQFGLNDACIPELVAQARRSSSMRYNPIALSEQALADVLRAAC